MTTRHADFSLRHAERLGDERLQRAIGFVVLRRSPHAGFEIRLAVCVTRETVDAICAAGRGEADGEPAQLSNVRVPVSMPSSQ